MGIAQQNYVAVGVVACDVMFGTHRRRALDSPGPGTATTVGPGCLAAARVNRQTGDESDSDEPHKTNKNFARPKKIKIVKSFEKKRGAPGGAPPYNHPS